MLRIPRGLPRACLFFLGLSGAPDVSVLLAQAEPVSPANQLTAAEAREGWRLLFDGHSTRGWRGYRRADMPAGWQVVDGALTRVGEGGDIITERQYRSFELKLEWKLGPRGNSGIFYLVTEDGEASYHSGPEMQVLDDAGHPDGGSRLTASGANYGLDPAPAGVVRPVGEWNEVLIRVRYPRVEHWLNGVKVVAYELGSPEWTRKVAESKFRQWPGYGQAARGHIALQDHGDWVAYRGIKIRELDP